MEQQSLYLFPFFSKDVPIVDRKDILILRHRQVASWSELERTPSQ